MHGISKFADLKRFLIYSTYAWGSTILMVVLCYLIDASSQIPSKYKPGMGVDTCFLQSKYFQPETSEFLTAFTIKSPFIFPESRLPEFLYLYLPIILIMICNSTFFIMTALKIRKVQLEMLRVTAKEDSKRHQKHLDNEKAK